MDNTLTDSQKAAAYNPNAFVLVLAGPGAGKTKTLAERMTYTLQNGSDIIHEMPYTEADVACITFTNGAAAEFTKRFRNAYTPDRPVKLGYCGTLHGLMLRIIKQHGALIGMKGRVAMMDEVQQERMLRLVMAEQKLAKLPMKELRAQLEVGPAIFFGTNPRNLTDAEQVAFEYYQRLLTASLLDFDSLLKFGLMVLRKMAEQKIKLPFKLLFWDEYQDSGDDDAAILQAMMVLHMEEVFVVGDPDQSIYGFRGGKPEHILQLATDPRFSIVQLEDNFRCDEDITRAANTLIAHNTERVQKQTISRTGQPGKVWTFRATTEAEEMRQIAEDINAQPDKNQCAVLVPYNPLAERVAKALEAFGIPICRKTKQAKPDDWQAARGLINLFANPDNDHLAYLFIEATKDKRFADKIKLQALTAFTSINRHYLKMPNDMALADVPESLARSGIKPESLELIGKAIATLPTDATMAELSFALGDTELHEKEVGHGVTVTTMHSAKGREWDTVYLPAFEEGMCPRATKSVNMQEERRIAFVSITRARHRLVVSFAEVRKPLFGGFIPEKTRLSRFANEIRTVATPVNNPETTGGHHSAT